MPMKLITYIYKIRKMRMKRRTLIEERYYGIKRQQMVFIKTVQERAAKMHTSWMPFLPNDLMIKIFLLLPIKSLMRFTSVCKSWYKLIHCAEFVEAYNTRVQTTPILLRGVDNERANTFHVETQLKLSENFSFFPCSSGARRSKFIHFLEIENDKGSLIDLNMSCYGSVVAACNGLILITSMHESRWKPRSSGLENLIGSDEKPGQLIVMNPMTRKLVGFPLGTLPYRLGRESYGLMFSHSTGVYKVVHLFHDKAGFIACEILSLQTRSWKAVDGPPGELSGHVRPAPISAIGALHFLPASGTDYLISMRADDETFFITDLPRAMRKYDRLLEMGGFLNFVSCLDKDLIEVWVLKGLDVTEWVKQHTIRIDAILGYVDNEEYSLPFFALNAKEMVFRRKDKLYSYDFELEKIIEIEMLHGRIREYDTILPHSNNLATWEPLESMS